MGVFADANTAKPAKAGFADAGAVGQGLALAGQQRLAALLIRTQAAWAITEPVSADGRVGARPLVASWRVAHTRRAIALALELLSGEVKEHVHA